MIQPTEPTYGVFVVLTPAGEGNVLVAKPAHLPVIAYATEGNALTPHFLPPGHVQTYNVFDVRDQLGSDHAFFLGLLIPDAAVPETSEQQWREIITNAGNCLDRARSHFESVVLSEELGAWLGETNGES